MTDDDSRTVADEPEKPLTIHETDTGRMATRNPDTGEWEYWDDLTTTPAP